MSGGQWRDEGETREGIGDKWRQWMREKNSEGRGFRDSGGLKEE